MSDSPRFRTVMRGYEPTQVDQRLAELDQALTAVRAELERHRAGAGDQQATIDQLRGP
jgi:DivIVA domain-containing protein